MSLNRAEKEVLAAVLISEAGNIVEFFSERSDLAPLRNAKVTADEVAECLAQWCKRLPGTAWDVRLPEASK